MIVHHNAVPSLPARVVLLGAHGFIGSSLRRQLKAGGITVIAPPSSELNLVEADAARKLADLLRSSDAVVMLAALTPDKGRDIATLMKNLAMMQALCAAIGKSGCAQLIYFSSDAVYDNAISRVSEGTPASPSDLYGTMHYTREVMARSLAEVPVLVLRPTLVYGVEDSHNSYGPNRFRRTALKDGKIILFGEGEEIRDHIHVDDVAALAVRCLMHESTGLLNVATGVSKSFMEISALSARHFARHIEIVKAPRANPVTHRHYDVTNLIKAFPDFRFIPVEDGIARMHQNEKGNP